MTGAVTSDGSPQLLHRLLLVRAARMWLSRPSQASPTTRVRRRGTCAAPSRWERPALPENGVRGRERPAWLDDKVRGRGERARGTNPFGSSQARSCAAASAPPPPASTTTPPAPPSHVVVCASCSSPTAIAASSRSAARFGWPAMACATPAAPTNLLEGRRRRRHWAGKEQERAEEQTTGAEDRWI